MRRKGNRSCAGLVEGEEQASSEQRHGLHDDVGRRTTISRRTTIQTYQVEPQALFRQARSLVRGKHISFTTEGIRVFKIIH